MKKITLASGILSMTSIFLFSCAHHKDVRPGVEGVHRVVVHAAEKEGAKRKAIKEANHFCDKEKNSTHAAFIEENTEYSGSMDEGTRNIVRNASKAAMIVGGSRIHRPGPSPSIGELGTAGYIFTNGNDYAADMKFKCE